MDWGKFLKGVALFSVAAYGYDVLLRPQIAANAAREAATRRRKPLLNIGAGTSASSLRALLFGSQIVGDVNMDISSDNCTCGPNHVCFGDVHQIPYPDRYFGAALASHVIEHVDNPIQALSELRRVADEVYVVVPRWWAPHTWLHPGHQWYISEDLERFFPLWRENKPLQPVTVNHQCKQLGSKK